MSKQRISWKHEMDKLNNSKSGRKVFKMSNANVASVTRVRLLSEWDGVDINAHNNQIILELK